MSALFRIDRIGREQSPVVIIDQAYPRLDLLRAHIETLTFTEAPGGFPGHRAPIEEAYLAPISKSLQSVLTDVFGLSNGVIIKDCQASLVTTPPEKLSVQQRRPHIDDTDNRLIAMMHYLDGEEKGGTAFFRQTRTGYETITPDRKAAYEADLERSSPPPQSFMTQSNEDFERIGAVSARINRLAIYRGNLLHSGDVPEGLSFEPDPKKARLSVNTFLMGR